MVESRNTLSFMKVEITKNHTTPESHVEYYYTLKEDTSLTPNTNMPWNSGRNHVELQYLMLFLYFLVEVTQYFEEY
jgi:hypothetical protein